MAVCGGKQHWEEFWSDTENQLYWTRPDEQVLNFIESQSPQDTPSVLDLGCGLGRHAIVFANAGFNVLALDSSIQAVEYLKQWAIKRKLAIRTKVSSLFDPKIPPASFDIVLSFNVIYHGFRRDFIQAVRWIDTLLTPGGFFYFTCPSRQDGKYGSGYSPAPHTYYAEKSMTPNDLHYFADESELDSVLGSFKRISKVLDEGYFDNNGEQQFFSNWHVVVQKKPPENSYS
jgi:SAM-dependent methyltransferase